MPGLFLSIKKNIGAYINNFFHKFHNLCFSLFRYEWGPK